MTMLTWQSLLKTLKMRSFVIDQNAIEIKNNPPDLHRNPVYITNGISDGQSARREALKSSGVSAYFLEFPLKCDHLHETHVMIVLKNCRKKGELQIRSHNLNPISCALTVCPNPTEIGNFAALFVKRVNECGSHD